MTAPTPSAHATEALDLSGRKGLVVGIANESSLAWQAARHYRNAGAELAVTFLNDKARPFVEPLVNDLAAPIFLPCDVSIPVRSRRYSTPSRRAGAASTSFSIPSRGRAGRICMGG